MPGVIQFHEIFDINLFPCLPSWQAYQIDSELVSLESAEWQGVRLRNSYVKNFFKKIVDI